MGKNWNVRCTATIILSQEKNELNEKKPAIVFIGHLMNWQTNRGKYLKFFISLTGLFLIFKPCLPD